MISDQKARPLRRKLRQRRLFSGDNSQRDVLVTGATGGGASWPGIRSGIGSVAEWVMAQPSRFSKSIRGSTKTYIRSDRIPTTSPIRPKTKSDPKMIG